MFASPRLDSGLVLLQLGSATLIDPFVVVVTTGCDWPFDGTGGLESVRFPLEPPVKFTGIYLLPGIPA
jgi:hypothetical protein